MLRHLFLSRTDRTNLAKIIGVWQLFRTEGENLDHEVTMEFLPDGTLVYAVTEGEKTELCNLVYELSGSALTTDQPSSPRKEMTTFFFPSEDVLVLDYEGSKSWFQRL